MQVPYRLPGSQYVQWVDVYTRMAFERIIFLDQEIDDNTANSIVALLLYLESDDSTKPIYLYINSPGERVSPGMGTSALAASLAVYDTMQHIKSPVNTICLGLAAGSAALLLAAGTKGSRASLPHSEIVLTPQYARAGGQASDIEIDAKKVLDDQRTFVEILACHSGQPIDTIVKDLDRRLYFTPKMAQEYGLLDRVLENSQQLPQPIPAFS